MMIPRKQIQCGFLKDQTNDELLRCARDRRIPISRARSVIVVYMERKITRTPMQSATKTTVSMKASSAGMLVDIMKLCIFSQRTEPVCREILCSSRSITAFTCSGSLIFT